MTVHEGGVEELTGRVCVRTAGGGIYAVSMSSSSGIAHWFQVIPFTPALLVIGTIMGLIDFFFLSGGRTHDAILRAQSTDGHTLMALFLPPLILADGMALEWKLVRTKGERGVEEWRSGGVGEWRSGEWGSGGHSLHIHSKAALHQREVGTQLPCYP